jgi:hypothetical protein
VCALDLFGTEEVGGEFCGDSDNFVFYERQEMYQLLEYLPASQERHKQLSAFQEGK